MVKCGKFNHISITVMDLNRTEKFYHDILGFEITARLDGLDCPDYAKATGVKNAKLNVMIAEGHGLAIEFMRFVLPESEPVRYMPDNPCASHICFEADDAEKMYEKIRMSGAEMIASEPVTISFGPHKGNTVWYFRDPDGYIIEMLTMRA